MLVYKIYVLLTQILFIATLVNRGPGMFLTMGYQYESSIELLFYKMVLLEILEN